MKFAKMHGAGNDFVMIEDLGDALAPDAELVRAVCDRNFGVGGDGVIRIVKSAGADFFMDYYNADGEAAEMCGNGIRCLAKYVADRGLHGTDEMDVDTRAGVKRLSLERADGAVVRVRVDMGPPVLEADRIPVLSEGDVLHEPIEVDGHRFDAVCLSMGNPHCVIFVDDLDAVPWARLGPAVEQLPKFPARVNAEFVQVTGAGSLRARVWERGSGPTLACGTGACAVGVAAVLRGYTGRSIAVHLPGGTLDIEWGDDDHVFMTGPVEEVFEGTLSAEFERRLRAAQEVSR